MSVAYNIICPKCGSFLGTADSNRSSGEVQCMECWSEVEYKLIKNEVKTKIK